MATSASFPEQAHQPRLYPFPKRSFGNNIDIRVDGNKVPAQRSFQPSSSTEQCTSVLIAGTLLCSMHACYCSLDTDFFFGIMLSLKNKCSFCVLGGVFLRMGELTALPHTPWLGGRGAPLPHPPRGTLPLNFGRCTFYSLPTPLSLVWVRQANTMHAQYFYEKFFI